mgnify:CR=1 FL=1|tara:strand:- start:218 stop:652 length:435 start_codon:yes stop_codon:yes gene_type:complete
MDTKQIGAYFSPGSYERHMTCSYCNSIYVATEDNIYVLYKPYDKSCFTSQCKVCESYTDIESVPGIVEERLLEREDGVLLHVNCHCKRGNKVGEKHLSRIFDGVTLGMALKVQCPICNGIESDRYIYRGYDRSRIKTETCCVIL